MSDKRKPPLRDRRRFMYIVLVAALCALTFAYSVYCLQRFGKYSTDYTPDEANYIAMARRLLSEHIYSFWGEGPDAYVTPGYPLLLTLSMALFGSGVKGLFAIKLTQCAMLALTVALTAKLTRRISGRYAAGLIAGTFVAGNFSFDYFATHMLTEVPYICFMMLFLTVFAEACHRDRLWLHAVSGAAFASAVLIRPMIFVTLPFWYLVPLIGARGKRLHVCKEAGVFLLSALALFAPWWIRNLAVLHRFVLFGTQTNPIFSGIAENIWQYGIDDPGTLTGNLALLLAFFRKQPLATLRWITFGKFQIIFINTFEPYQMPGVTTLCQHLTVYVGLCGSVCALLSRRLRGAAVTFCVYFAVTFLFVPEPRFALQYIPPLAIFAGWLITANMAQVRRENAAALSTQKH